MCAHVHVIFYYLSRKGTTAGTKKQPRRAGAGIFASSACPLQPDAGYQSHPFITNNGNQFGIREGKTTQNKISSALCFG